MIDYYTVDAQHIYTGVVQIDPYAPLPPAGGGIKAFDGAAWVAAAVKRWNGSAWTAATTKRFDGTAWLTM